ncbi:MAG: alpha/beta hydrolase [Actinobacteria bacterium]|nr:alpha/beta hydrolase [Actinomycetota bacterium]MBU1944554.1 alpha/beta hydrolase [Actinomycetota bacterium]MBU2689107.1 alpha/beta hydrolase [Actinomycetota bacterium]
MPVETIDGVNIAYETRGEGRPLVFLHCWTGNKAFYFEQVARFSRDYRCICLDFPGHGDSGECEEYSVENFGELTAELLRRLGVDQAVFAGHSLGGIVALYLALEHPDMVEGLILLDTTSYLSQTIFQRIFALAAVFFGTIGYELSRTGFRHMKGLVAGIAATHPLATPQSRLITARECSKVSNYSMARTLNNARKFNVTQRLGEIEAPAMVVVGTGDMLADVRHAKVLARGLENSTITVVHGAGHMALFEKPEVVNEAIEVFLKRVYPAGAAGAKRVAKKPAKKPAKKKAARKPAGNSRAPV